MKIIPFPGAFAASADGIPVRQKRLAPEADLDEVLAKIKKHPCVPVLFLDEHTEFWRMAVDFRLREHFHLVALDEEMLKHFNVQRIPQFSFFDKGFESMRVVGTRPPHELLHLQQMIFGKIIQMRS